MSLKDKQCIPCKGGVAPFTPELANSLLKELSAGWKVANGHHLEREFQFQDFKSALSFTNKIGLLAEQEGHHPDILTSWGKVKVTIWTHKINGLTESDFILAAKIDALQ
jgi:4a-hydroxytetrahydrobiopterin dehydratase